MDSQNYTTDNTPSDSVYLQQILIAAEAHNKKSSFFSIVTLIILLLMLCAIIATGLRINGIQDDINDISETTDYLYESVEEIRENTYDLVEQGCNASDDISEDLPDPDHVSHPSLAKPVIYIYPDTPDNRVEVNVELSLTSPLAIAWPEYNNKINNTYSWDVFVAPDGTIYDNKGDEYSYIFWEAEGYGDHTFDKGFCIKGKDTADFLKKTLSEIGLTPAEYNEFIVYWLPKMQDNPYNLITFEGLDKDDAYSRNCKLTVTDASGREADSVLRIMMAWKALDAPVKIEPQTFTCFERNGFTVVEWGGTEIY